MRFFLSKVNAWMNQYTNTAPRQGYKIEFYPFKKAFYFLFQQEEVLNLSENVVLSLSMI